MGPLLMTGFWAHLVDDDGEVVKQDGVGSNLEKTTNYIT